MPATPTIPAVSSKLENFMKMLNTKRTIIADINPIIDNPTKG
ncbi:hypothetical protein GCM10027443_12210 [Pontibacter brevis]